MQDGDLQAIVDFVPSHIAPEIEIRSGDDPDVVDAGPGDDLVISIAGKTDTVDCGEGYDTARVDRTDRLQGCEKVLYR